MTWRTRHPWRLGVATDEASRLDGENEPIEAIRAGGRFATWRVLVQCDIGTADRVRNRTAKRLRATVGCLSIVARKPARLKGRR